MKEKSFFKSTAFKCLVTLLSIILVCCIFLTFCNSLFYVSDAERLDRAVAKIYGKSVATEEIELTDEEKTVKNATIKAAYLVTDDGNYLVKSTGKGGFSGGSVTCWVVVTLSGNEVSGIQKVVVDSNVGQSYIGKVTDSFLNSFTSEYKEEYAVSDGFVSAGASYSSTAICNSVNGAIEFVKARTGENNE